MKEISLRSINNVYDNVVDVILFETSIYNKAFHRFRSPVGGRIYNLLSELESNNIFE